MKKCETDDPLRFSRRRFNKRLFGGAVAFAFGSIGTGISVYKTSENHMQMIDQENEVEKLYPKPSTDEVASAEATITAFEEEGEFIEDPEVEKAYLIRDSETIFELQRNLATQDTRVRRNDWILGSLASGITGYAGYCLLRNEPIVPPTKKK